MNQENKEIAVYVAYKGVIALIESGVLKLTGTPEMFNEKIEHTVRSHFEILQRISASEATESQINYLKTLLETCTLEPEHIANYKYELTKPMSYIDYVKLRDIFKENQKDREFSMAQINKNIDNEVAKDDEKDRN